MSQNDTPDPTAQLFNEAVGLHTDGQLGEAIPIYESILEQNPRHSDALHLLGLAKYQMGDAQNGATLIERAIEINPADAGYRSNLGSVYRSMGRIEDAIAILESATEIDPKFLPAHYNVAELHCGQNNLEKGEASYRRAVALNPELPEILSNLGLCLVAQKKQEEGEKFLLQALEKAPDFSPALYGMGHLREEQGMDGEAMMLYGQALRFGFDRAACLRRLAMVALRSKEPERSIEHFDALIEMGQADANVYNNLALAYQNMKEPEKEIEALRTGLELDPKHIECLTNYAAALTNQGNYEESIACSLTCIEIDPKCDIAYNNLGAAYKALARLDDAIEAYQKAIAINPDRAEHFNNIGLAQESRGLIVEMEASFKQAIQLDPDYATAYSNYASALMNFGRLTEAKTHLDKALVIDALHPVAWNNIARYHYEVGSFEQSYRAYKRFLEIDPENRLAAASIAATQIIRDDVDDDWVYQTHLESGQRIESLVEPFAHAIEARARPDGEPLRVGFISSDFRSHSVTYFLEPLLEKLDQSRFQIHCYSGVRNKDRVTNRLEALAHVWRDVCDLSDDRLAAMILEDKVDILVDLAGYTSGNRVSVFAQRPAPVQINWLGYPHSTGMARIDYRIVDAETDPEGKTLNSESLYRIPGCFLCYRPHPDSPEVAPLPMATRTAPTFGSFNNLTKLTAKSIALFARVLTGSPGSSLLLKSHQATDPTMRSRILKGFKANGITEDRIEFLPKYPKIEDHLGAYNRVDVALDTYPYNGTTTTCEALWMGVPVVTLRGTRHASRVSASLLHALDLDAFVTDSADDFVKAALAQSSDASALAVVRNELRDRFARSILRDEARFAKAYETALDTMWSNYLSGS